VRLRAGAGLDLGGFFISIFIMFWNSCNNLHY